MKLKSKINAWQFHYRRFRRGYSNLPDNSRRYSAYKAWRMVRNKSAYMSGKKLVRP